MTNDQPAVAPQSVEPDACYLCGLLAAIHPRYKTLDRLAAARARNAGVHPWVEPGAGQAIAATAVAPYVETLLTISRRASSWGGVPMVELKEIIARALPPPPPSSAPIEPNDCHDCHGAGGWFNFPVGMWVVCPRCSAPTEDSE